MSKSKFLAAALMAIPAATFAQDLTSSAPAEATPAPVFESEPAPAPAPVFAPAPAPAAASAASPEAFDNLRGRAYGTVASGNEAAAFTAGDYLDWPHLMGGSQFLYVEPAANYGTVSANLGGSTFFMNLDNTGTLGMLTIGMAKADAWGVELHSARDWSVSTSKPSGGGDETTTTTYGANDQIGVGFSTKLGNNALRVSADMITPQTQTSTKTGTVENEQSYNRYIIDADFSNFPSGNALVWTAGAEYNRLSLTTKAAGAPEAIQPDANTLLNLSFDLGMKVLSNSQARVLVGSDNSFGIQMWDDLDNVRKDSSSIRLLIAPNILGEYSFTENWMVMGGVQYALVAMGFGGATTPNGPERTQIWTKSNATIASAGIRYQRDSFAAEASIAQQVFKDGPSAFFSGSDHLMQFGAFLYF